MFMGFSKYSVIKLPTSNYFWKYEKYNLKVCGLLVIERRHRLFGVGKNKTDNVFGSNFWSYENFILYTVVAEFYFS